MKDKSKKSGKILKNCFAAALSAVLAVSAATAAFGFVSCKKGEEANEGQTICLYDFETGLANVRMSASFGKIGLNEKENFVASGKRSASLAPDTKGGTASPYMYLPFESSLLGFNQTKTDDLYEIQFTIFATEEITLEAGLYFSSAAEMKSVPETFKLKSGRNDIKYRPDYTVISVQYDTANLKGLYLAFSQTTTVYLDDVKIVRRQIERSFENFIILKRTDEYQEICDFENAYQQLAFAANTGNTATAPAPQMKAVKATDEGIEAVSGENVLKITANPTTSSGTHWSQIALSEPVMNAVNFKKFAADVDSYELCFSVYQAGDDRWGENISLSNLFELNAYPSSGSMDYAATTTKKGEWKHVRIPLKKLEKFVNSPSMFAFAWIEPVREGNYVYYLDDLCIRRTGK